MPVKRKTLYVESNKIKDAKAKLRTEQSERAAQRVAKLRKSGQYQTDAGASKSPEEEYHCSKRQRKDVVESTFGEDAEDFNIKTVKTAKGKTRVSPVPSLSQTDKVKVNESFSFRTAILKSRTKSGSESESDHAPKGSCYEFRDSIAPLDDEINPHLGAGLLPQQTLKQTIVIQLEKTAVLLVKLIALLIVSVVAYHLVLGYLLPSHVDTFCSSDADFYPCSPCPLHGVCISGSLVGCESGYSLPTRWNIFRPAKNSFCEEKLSSKFRSVIRWGFPYVSGMVLIVGTWWWRRRTARRISTQAHNWIKETWSILNSTEDPMPLVRTHIQGDALC